MNLLELEEGKERAQHTGDKPPLTDGSIGGRGWVVSWDKVAKVENVSKGGDPEG